MGIKSDAIVDALTLWRVTSGPKRMASIGLARQWQDSYYVIDYLPLVQELVLGLRDFYLGAPHLTECRLVIPWGYE